MTSSQVRELVTGIDFPLMPLFKKLWIDCIIVSELLVDKCYTFAMRPMTYPFSSCFCIERLRCRALALLFSKVYTL